MDDDAGYTYGDDDDFGDDLENPPDDEIKDEDDIEMEVPVVTMGPTCGRILEKSERRGRDILSDFERARVLGIRAEQIGRGSRPMVNHGSEIRPLKIAEMELEIGVLPLIIRRRNPDGTCEDWAVSELRILR